MNFLNIIIQWFEITNIVLFIFKDVGGASTIFRGIDFVIVSALISLTQAWFPCFITQHNLLA